MEWPKFLERSNSQDITSGLFNASSQDNHQIGAQVDLWTLEEKRFFKSYFSKLNKQECECFFEYAASKMPYMSMEEIKNHYNTIIKDVEMENSVPENKVVPDANYHQLHQVPQDPDESNMEATLNITPPVQVEKCPHRRSRILWTKEEHELFLMGLNIFGKGKWKNISKYCVVSKTMIQVANHAYNYFSRQNSKTPVERRRSSINDIQTVTSNLEALITMPMGPEINNGRFVYPNNHQAGSSSQPTIDDGSTFNNNSNTNFERFNHQGEASDGSSLVIDPNNNNNNNIFMPVSPRPLISMHPSSARMNNGGA